MNATQKQFPNAAIFIALLLLTLSAPVQAQLTYTTNNGTITITGGGTGPGIVQIPSTINGLPVTSIGEFAFFQRSDLGTVFLPNSVVNIGASAFRQCTSLWSTRLRGVTNIGDSAFSQCTSLTSLYLPLVSNVGPYAFSSCHSLASVWLGPVSTISDNAFNSCFNLTEVNIPKTVTNIEGAAFRYCYNLTSVTIPDSVTTVGGSAFGACSSLTGVYFQGNAPNAGSDLFSGSPGVTVYYLPGTTGWGPTLGGRPTVLWNPQAQTSDESFGVRTNQFGFTITGTPNIPIVVEATTTSLPTPEWVPLQSCTLTNGSLYFSDPQWTNYPTRFYRIRSP